ncbi:alpha/beta fold hydrolase [Acetobacter conturbans]|uniref:alpha/beta fold hydrolase n=1 Tax=Acetobacter conturbans TaxID=1737472 RepID=UPI0038D17CDD
MIGRRFLMNSMAPSGDGHACWILQTGCWRRRVFYREAGPANAPILLLLHGFPTASHMFWDLIPLLADHYRIIVPGWINSHSVYSIMARRLACGSHYNFLSAFQLLSVRTAMPGAVADLYQRL